MTYANAVLPHALFDAAERWPDEEFLSVAETSFGFLNLVTTAEDVFWPIGNRDWYSHGEEKSLYDQQPVEASTMAAAAFAAYLQHGDDKYLAVFRRAHEWFLGKNSLQTTARRCAEWGLLRRLEADGVNKNQGAESTLAYLWTELLGFEVSQAVPAVTKKSVTAGSSQ